MIMYSFLSIRTEYLIICCVFLVIVMLSVISHLVLIPKNKKEDNNTDESTVELDKQQIEAVEKISDNEVNDAEEIVIEDEPLTNNVEVETENTPEIVQNKRKGKYEIFKEGDLYRYRLKAANGEVLVESELYPTEQIAIDAVEIIKKNVETGIYQIVEDKNNCFKYKLSSRNHRTLITSTFFNTKKSAEDACDAFKRNALTEITIVLNENSNTDEGSMEKFTDVTQNFDSTGSYEVLPSGKKFYFILKAQNGSTLCHSQDFVSKTSCITFLEQFREIVYDGTFYISKDKNNKFQFKLYNKQNKLVLVGDLYDNKNRVISYIKLIKRYAKLAAIN